MHNKFLLLGNVNNVNSTSSPGATHSGRPKTSTSDQNKQRVKAVMDRDRVKEHGDNTVSPISSGRRNSLILDKSAFWRLAKELQYHPYKPVRRHTLAGLVSTGFVASSGFFKQFQLYFSPTRTIFSIYCGS